MPEIKIQGIAASAGIGIGPIYIYRPRSLEVPHRQPQAFAVEFARFEAARDQAILELQKLRSSLASSLASNEAEILDAHIEIVRDEMLSDAVRSHLQAGQGVEEATASATEEIAALFSGMENEMFAARSADVKDVGRRLVRILLGLPDISLSAISQPSSVIANDLAPTDTARLNPKLVLGICTASGGATSHSAILARTLGIPAVLGAGSQILEQAQAGEMAILDGSHGQIILDPGDETLAYYRREQQARSSHLAVVQEGSQQESRMADGRRVEVGANVGDVASAREALHFGAEGVGLLRTEFLYLQETQPPSESVQIERYRQIFDLLGNRPVIVRTLDIGGDKPPAYVDFGKEMNPFLGWRAIRVSFENLPLFKTQLRAVLRAAVGHRVLLMLPMVISVDELRQAKDILGQVRSELDAQGVDYQKEITLGIMIETPAAAAIADLLAQECDFFSLGTNDLTQYTLAVDRTNERIARLYQPLHPAVLRLIQQTIESSHAHGIWTGMCGELAGMSQAIPLLLGMGLDEFSMVPRAIPEAKWLIRKIRADQAKEIANEALALKTAAEVEAFMQDVLGRLES